MHPRKTLLELFSTFLQFEGDRFNSWVTEPKLRRSMMRLISSASLDSSPETAAEIEPQNSRSEQFWAIYWFKGWQAQPDSLGKVHLAAYLQEVCYWAAQKTVISFNINQYPISDCFQIAIGRLDKILRGFNPSQSINLKAYAGIAFSSIIREFLRQRRVVDICSDWALLRKISRKRLISALQESSMPVEQMPAVLLAWRCFKAIYLPTQATSTRSLPKPEDAIWQRVAKQYNSDRKSSLPPLPEASPTQIGQWMQQCIKATRAYLHPITISINTPRPGQESGELLDTLTDDADSLLTQLIAEEEQQVRQTQQSQINQVLLTALANLDPKIQQLLELYYGRGYTQQEMATQMDMKQYTISRRFSKAREVLLLALANWSHETLKVPQTQDLLNQISPILEEWLSCHYQSATSANSQ